MNQKKSIILFILAFILQTSLFNYILVNQVTPDLILCLLMMAAITTSSKIPVIYGFLAGMLMDIMYAQVFGVTAGVYVTTWLIIHLIKNYINWERLIFIILLPVVMTFYKYVAFGLSLKVFGLSYNLIDALSTLGIEIILNIVTMLILYFVYFKRKIRRYKIL